MRLFIVANELEASGICTNLILVFNVVRFGTKPKKNQKKEIFSTIGYRKMDTLNFPLSSWQRRLINQDGIRKIYSVNLFRMLDDRQLVHPVHERMAFLNDTFEFAVDTGDQFITGEQVTGIHRHLFCTQEIGLDPFFPELRPLNEPAFLKFLDNPRTFAAVNPQFFPELALEDSFGFRLDKFQCFINRIFHGDHLACS